MELHFWPNSMFSNPNAGFGPVQGHAKVFEPKCRVKTNPPISGSRMGVEWVDRVGWVWGGVGWLLLWCCLHAVAGLAPASSQH